MKTAYVALALCAGTLLFPECASAQIDNIYRFLQSCPTSDPAISQILNDFKIRSNGVMVTSFPCQEPISSMALSNYTDPLLILQGLRVIYYMDRGQSGYLPWTSGTLYNWMKSQIKGIDVRTDASFSFCCETFTDGVYIVVAAEDDSNRDFDRTWRGIAGNIDLYAHETRHVAGFPHSSCCGIAGGCDNLFDTNNLSPYGIQWWLNKAWLNGQINVGFACADSATVSDAANWHLSVCNSGFRTRFCTNQPPILALPSNPGGGCPVHQSIHFSQPSQVQICWNSLTNKNYQVQYRSDLATATWTNLGPQVPGNGSTNCVIDSLSAWQRFYRVFTVP